MKQYKFGKRELATMNVGNKMFVSRLSTSAKPDEKICMTDKDAICFVFTSLSSVDKMITDLKFIKKNMSHAKLKKLLETIL